MIVLQWYFGFCAKRELGDPSDRQNGRIFWKEAVLTREPQKWQLKQWTAAMKWYFESVGDKDEAGRLMRSALRRRHLRFRTEQGYLGWLRRFQAFLHPKDAILAEAQDVVRFLTMLAEKEQVASSTQNQAFNALLFFFRHPLAGKRGGYPYGSGVAWA